MSLTICPAYDRPEEVKALFLEYTDFLLKSDPSFAAFLELQNYDRELDHLEEKYGLPKGTISFTLHSMLTGLSSMMGQSTFSPFLAVRCISVNLSTSLPLLTPQKSQA